MDWSSFDEHFERLQAILKRTIDKDKNSYKSEVYANYLCGHDELKLIVRRIEAESEQYIPLVREIIKRIEKREKPDALSDRTQNTIGQFIENTIYLSIDIKSFFVFTRIFLDTLARMIRLFFGKAGEGFPWSMRQLIEHKGLVEIDSVFAERLKRKMLWIENFVKKRVEIEHYLGLIHSTPTRKGKYGFDILGSRDRRDWGTDTVEGITEYIGKVIENLTEVFLLIYERFQVSP